MRLRWSSSALDGRYVTAVEVPQCHLAKKACPDIPASDLVITYLEKEILRGKDTETIRLCAMVKDIFPECDILSIGPTQEKAGSAIANYSTLSTEDGVVGILGSEESERTGGSSGSFPV